MLFMRQSTYVYTKVVVRLWCEHFHELVNERLRSIFQ